MRAPSLGRAVALSAVLALFAGCGDDDDGSVTADTGSTILTTSIPADETTTGRSDESSTSAAAPAGTVIELTISGGEVTRGGGRVSVPLGDPVVIQVDADEADELHLHGYDLYLELVPGETAELRFDATIPGVFELEGHDSGVVVAELEIS